MRKKVLPVILILMLLGSINYYDKMFNNPKPVIFSSESIRSQKRKNKARL